MSTKPMAEPSHWAFEEQAFLKKIPYPVVPTNLKGAYAGIAWADSFDPNTASATDLIKNGLLWRRPTATDHPGLRAAWQHAFSRKWHAQDRVVPVLEPQIGRTHNLRKPLKKGRDTNYNNGAWAGAATAKGGPYSGIIANWKVPTVSKPSEPASSSQATTRRLASAGIRPPGSGSTASMSQSFPTTCCRPVSSSMLTPPDMLTTSPGTSGSSRAIPLQHTSIRRTSPIFRSAQGT